MKYSRKISITLFCLTSVLFLILNSKITPQALQNLTVKQSEDTLFIGYSLISNIQHQTFEVSLKVSNNNGKTYDITPINVWGDIGGGVKPGQKKTIYWLPLEDSLELIGSDYVFSVSAEILGASKVVEFIDIPAGTFIMGNAEGSGDSDENYKHQVNISAFKIGKYEVTNLQFLGFLQSYGSDEVKSGEFKGEKMIYPHPKGITSFESATTGGQFWQIAQGAEYNPVINVTWFGANEFSKFFGYRLPSEAEWEYTARQLGDSVVYGNGNNTAYPTEINFKSWEGTSLAKNIIPDSIYTVPVCSYKPNKLSIYDMSGNVWEWCQDWYKSNYYFGSKIDNPSGPVFGRYKVIRGGSWFSGEKGITTTKRNFIAPYEAKIDIGFRVVKEIAAQ